MEPFNRRPIDRAPHRPMIGAPIRPTHMARPVGSASAQPSALRPPVVAPQPAMDIRPASHPTSNPAPSSAPVAQPARPNPTPTLQPRPITPVATAPVQHTTAFSAPTANAVKRSEPRHTTHEPKPHKEPHETGHAGLVGLITFVVFMALFFAPLFPGKVWQDAPGSSQSFSTGDQNISCLGTLGPQKTTVSYNSKTGFPVVYSYSTTSTVTASCDGKPQQATSGHTSQFNPLGVAIDVVLALVLAVTVAKIWHKLRAPKINHAH